MRQKLAISIHALLAESDTIPRGGHISEPNFYPRSPCGERHVRCFSPAGCWRISIHALLAESDLLLRFRFFGFVISIHALLAESDLIKIELSLVHLLFLSTLSLRRATDRRGYLGRPDYISIHALLAESDVSLLHFQSRPRDFYPRSPCGERQWFSGF